MARTKQLLSLFKTMPDYVIDASGQKLGRLASHIAQILQGKMDAGYAPHIAGKDRVIVKNASQIVVSGRKSQQKIYYRHTGYMGHLYKKTYRQKFEKSPEKVLYNAVYSMLPKNFLRGKRLVRLEVQK